MTCPHCQPSPSPTARATPAGDDTDARARRAPIWRWARIGFCALLAAWGMILGLAINTTEAAPGTRLAIHLALAAMAALAFALLGTGLLRDTWRAIRARRLTLEPLFLSALLGAAGFSIISVIRGEGAVYFETVIVVLVIYSLGAELTARARTRAGDAIQRLAAGPAEVRRLTARGIERVAPEALRPGDEIEIRPGDEIPIDGVAIEGRALVRQAAMTGEPHPVPVGPGDRVLAGTHPSDAMLRVRTLAPVGRRRMDEAVETIGPDLVARARIVRAAERLLRWFVPLVWVAALATFIGWAALHSVERGLINALAVLLIACPCALGFATPTALWAACVAMARLGIRASDPDLVEQLARIDTLAIDKTGTITDERARIGDVFFAGDAPLPRDDALALIGATQQRSDHPVAEAFAELAPERASTIDVRTFEVVPGAGVRAEATLDGRTHQVWIGRAGALSGEAAEQAARARERLHAGQPGQPDEPVAAVIDGSLICLAAVSESPRPGWGEALAGLRARGVRTILLTGDGAQRAADIEADERLAGLMPDQKRAHVRALRDAGHAVGYVGDGINDAAAMAAADAALAVATGAPLAGSTAHATLDADRLGALPEAVGLSRRTARVLRNNLRIAAGYNAIGIAFAAAGLLHPVLAAVIMVVSSLIVTMRSLAIAEPPRPSDRSAPARARAEASEHGAPEATPAPA